MRICIVIPVHNEAQTIGTVVTKIRSRGLDVLVIDDGSIDSSVAIAQEKGAVVLLNAMRQGKGKTLQRGFKEALGQGYDGVITMDGDGQHAPEDLEIFMAKIQQNPMSIVTGSRMENPQGMPFVRFLTNRFMSWLISLICKQRIPDTQCGYRYIPRVVLEKIPLTCCDFEIETEVLIKASRLGVKIFSVPVKTIYGQEESKINPFRDTIRFFAYLWRELWRRQI